MGRITDDIPPSHDIMFRVSRFFAALWVFVLGTCVGSFLNVVIYRVPQKISVLVQGSYCPQCREPIRPQDNLPLLGWLRLRGECHHCGLPISARYPIVEFTIGLLFLLLFFVELISGGANLPVRVPNRMTGVQWTVFEPQWDLFALFLDHCFLVCSLFSWAMIRRDGHDVPRKTVMTILGIAFIAPLLLPHLLPWPWWQGSDRLLLHPSLTAAWTSAIGMICGVIAASVLSIDFDTGHDDRAEAHVASWLLIGASLGWQAVAGISVLMFGWRLLCPAVGKLFTREELAVTEELPVAEESNDGAHGDGTSARRFGHLALPLVTLIHHMAWRQIASLFVDF